MAFVLNKVIDLGKYGWEGCSLTFSALSYGELKDLQQEFLGLDTKDPQNADRILSLLQDKFISGTAKNEKQENVTVDKDKLIELPFEILIDASGELMGGVPDPNLSRP